MKQLVLPDPPWGRRAGDPPQERLVFHPPPSPPNPREDARRKTARALADEAIAALDPALVAAARLAYDANNAASQALNEAQAELAALTAEDAGLADVDMDDATLEGKELRRITLERHIPTLQRRLEKAQQQAEQAIGAARQALVLQARFGVFSRIREEARARDVAAEQLMDEAGSLRLSIAGAESFLASWLPPKEVTDG